MSTLAILGASGHGTVVADAALRSGWDSVVFFDDAWPSVGSLGHWAVVGESSAMVYGDTRFDRVVIAIGDNRTRLAKQQEMESRGLILASVVHPSATVSPLADLGRGSVVFAGAVVNPFASLGRGCIVNTAASVDHHCKLADGVHVSPGAHLGGSVRVGEASWIGIGASVKHGLMIGAGVIVGAGAAVVRDVGDGLTVVGVPARTRVPSG